MQLIAAADARWGIGKDGKLLVSIPDDMKYFQSVTIGHTVIMGRRTLESFPGKRPLKNRSNIVLTRQKNLKIEGARTAGSVEEVLRLTRELGPDEVFCIGGAEVYRLFLPFCDTALITRIDTAFDADAFLPNLDQAPGWKKVKESGEQIFFDLTYRFCTYKRIGS